MNNSAVPYKNTCECIVHIVKNGYLILFALHEYICVIRTFSLSGQVLAPCSPEKRGSSAALNSSFNLVFAFSFRNFIVVIIIIILLHHHYEECYATMRNYTINFCLWYKYT